MSIRLLALIALLFLAYFVVKMLALFRQSKEVEKTLDYDKMKEWEEDED